MVKRMKGDNDAACMSEGQSVPVNFDFVKRSLNKPYDALIIHG